MLTSPGLRFLEIDGLIKVVEVSIPGDDFSSHSQVSPGKQDKQLSFHQEGPRPRQMGVPGCLSAEPARN